MTAAFYYPTVIERVICEKCGTVKSEEVTPARVMAQPVIASIEVPAKYRFRLQPDANQC